MTLNSPLWHVLFLPTLPYNSPAGRNCAHLRTELLNVTQTEVHIHDHYTWQQQGIWKTSLDYEYLLAASPATLGAAPGHIFTRIPKQLSAI